MQRFGRCAHGDVIQRKPASDNLLHVYLGFVRGLFTGPITGFVCPHYLPKITFCASLMLSYRLLGVGPLNSGLEESLGCYQIHGFLEDIVLVINRFFS